MHLVLGQSTLLYVSSTFVSWWRRTKLLHITYRRSVNSLTSERSIWRSIVLNNFYRWSRASNFIDVIVGVLCSFVCSVSFSFLFRKSRFVLSCIRSQKPRFSFASSLIERFIKDIFSTLMYVCVKRNVCLNLWLANMLYFVFIDVVITLFFWFTMHCNFHWGGVIWKCWCMSMYWSMLSSTALVCIVHLTSIVDLICAVGM